MVAKQDKKSVQTKKASKTKRVLSTASAVAKERQRIAQELHDDLGQILTALKMELSFIKTRLKEKEIAAGLKQLNMSLGTLDQAITSMRRITTRLQPVMLEKYGLLPALKLLLDNIKQHRGMDYTIDATQKISGLDTVIASVIFRTVQEALTNILKHTEATKVEINLQLVKNQVRLEIRDNGKGFPASVLATKRGLGLGLQGMHERADECGGKLTVKNRRTSSGAEIIMTLPLEQPLERG